jgi:hypothetical protein
MKLEKRIKALRSVELHETFWHLIKGVLKLIINKMKVKARYDISSLRVKGKKLVK